MSSSGKVVTFDRAAVAFIGMSVAALVVAVGMFPPSQVTRSPKATMVLPAAAALSPDRARSAGALARRNSAPATGGLTVGSLAQTFLNLDYNLEDLRSGGGSVPRLFLTGLPQDMSKIAVPAVRKSLFFRTVLPIVLRVNDEIRSDRRRLLRLGRLAQNGQRLDAADRLWLAALSERYGVARNDFEALGRRVDYVPPSLALAQAAEESGWGTSRFAVEGNALFGQWTFGRTRGLIPGRRDQGKNHQIRSFATLFDAAKAYTINLNTHPAYRKFRQERRALRAADRPLDGLSLAGTLTRYSLRGRKYVRSLRAIIAVNRLGELDHVRLGNEVPRRRI